KIAFALDDPKANFILTLYQAVGGLVEDNQRRPMIESEPLTEALTFLQDNVDTYAYRELVLQLQNELQVWQAYQNEFTEAAVISVSVFLQNKPGNSAMIPLPPVNDISITTGSGWVWAIATPLAERQALGIKLAEKLVESDFLSSWNSAYGGMPPRPSSLEQWQDLGERLLISQISLMTILQPSNDIMSSLAPIFRDAGMQVVRDQIDPQTAAQAAIERLK
ncbi:MAG: hypothetical protein MUO40_07495, partial [Anaerolineaceae bacterium]|nr:hypothetical protein [Anaerolineaceae bacterium]